MNSTEKRFTKQVFVFDEEASVCNLIILVIILRAYEKITKKII